MNASDIIKLAEKHHTNNSSAWYCLSDARKCLERGEEEYAKNEKRIAETLATIAEYEELINDPKKRTKVYVDELNDVLTKYKKGVYKEKEA